MLLVPFVVTIPDREKDPHLPEKLSAELSGILNWAIAGCLAYQRDGLSIPDDVRYATQEYRAEQDVLGQFLSECCDTTDPAGEVPRSAMRSAYDSWCRTSGATPWQPRTFNDALRERGIRVISQRKWQSGSMPEQGWGGLKIINQGAQGVVLPFHAARKP